MKKILFLVVILFAVNLFAQEKKDSSNVTVKTLRLLLVQKRMAEINKNLFIAKLDSINLQIGALEYILSEEKKIADSLASKQKESKKKPEK